MRLSCIGIDGTDYLFEVPREFYVDTCGPHTTHGVTHGENHARLLLNNIRNRIADRNHARFAI